MEWLLNPWVIVTIVMAIMIGNLMALKYLGKASFSKQTKTTKNIDKLLELDKKLQAKKYDNSLKKGK